jgi:hypothetical protein
MASMTKQTDLFDRTAECERLMDVASDPDRKELLKLFRDVWIVLANERATVPADRMIKQIADLERLRVGLSQ